MISLQPIGNRGLSGHDHGHLLVRGATICFDFDITIEAGIAGHAQREVQRGRSH